jgi:hypothetical protein
MSILNDDEDIIRRVIYTKFLSPSPTMAQRVKAVASGGALIKEWDFDLSIQANHNRVASAIAEKLGWTNDFRVGHIDNGFVYIPV